MKNKQENNLAPFVATSVMRGPERAVDPRAPVSPLTSPKLGVKLFFAPGSRVEAKEMIALFQRWIREDTLRGEGMIDVVRYRHVKDGPWVMLVGTTSHYSIDGADGRPGLRFSRRRRAGGSAGERLRSAFASTLNAARLIEKETELWFVTDEVELSIDDRLAAPNTRETFELVERELRSFALLLFEGAEIDPLNAVSPKNPFRVRIRAAKRRSLEELADRLDALRARALLMS